MSNEELEKTRTIQIPPLQYKVMYGEDGKKQSATWSILNEALKYSKEEEEALSKILAAAPEKLTTEFLMKISDIARLRRQMEEAAVKIQKIVRRRQQTAGTRPEAKESDTGHTSDLLFKIPALEYIVTTTRKSVKLPWITGKKKAKWSLWTNFAPHAVQQGVLNDIADEKSKDVLLRPLTAALWWWRKQSPQLKKLHKKNVMASTSEEESRGRRREEEKKLEAVLDERRRRRGVDEEKRQKEAEEEKKKSEALRRRQDIVAERERKAARKAALSRFIAEPAAGNEARARAAAADMAEKKAKEASAAAAAAHKAVEVAKASGVTEAEVAQLVHQAVLKDGKAVSAKNQAKDAAVRVAARLTAGWSKDASADEDTAVDAYGDEDADISSDRRAAAAAATAGKGDLDFTKLKFSDEQKALFNMYAGVKEEEDEDAARQRRVMHAKAIARAGAERRAETAKVSSMSTDEKAKYEEDKAAKAKQRADAETRRREAAAAEASGTPLQDIMQGKAMDAVGVA